MKNPLKNELLGKKLGEQRTCKGIKQLTVARKLQVSLSYISKLENGKAPIYAIILIQYCNAIGLSVTDFLSSIIDTIV